MKTVEVIAPGTTVGIGPKGEIEATIAAVSMRGNGVQYQVTWWNGNSRCSEWCEPHEIHEAKYGARKITIGFAKACA
jgi:hypothetical protein